MMKETKIHNGKKYNLNNIDIFNIKMYNIAAV